MKLLFICSNDFKTSSGGGGSQCTNRNYMSLVEIFGTENVDVIQLDTPLKKNIRSIFSRVLNYMKGYNAGVSKSVISNIIERSLYYEHIFIDSSFFGVISKHLKQHNYQGQIISFFHNVEHLMSLQETKTNPLAFWRSLIVYYNEKCAVRFSDQIIMLNDRDLKKLENIYGNFHKTVSHIIPISFKDRFSAGINNLEEQTKVPPVILFLGSTWFPNIHGITWFIEEVLEHVDIKLQIAGGASNVLQKKFHHRKIEYLGFVPDLSNVIMNADVMLAPLFKGGGMKVKICEALMYGKNIMGTKEAFIGYNLEYKKAGAECNSKGNL